MTDTPNLGVNARMVLRLIPFIMVAITVATVYTIDTKFLPVVQDFRVESARRSGAWLLIQGSMKQVRSCDFRGLKVYGMPENGEAVDLPFILENGTHTKGVGFQTWGPWQIVVPTVPNVRYIDIQATHRCTGPWVQTATYTKFDLRTVK